MLSREAQISYMESVLSMNGISAAKYGQAMAEALDAAFFDDEYGCMMLMLNTAMKKRIAAKIGAKSAGPVTSGVAAMTEAGLLKETAEGLYAFNPAYFGSKHWKSIDEIKISHAFGKAGEAVLIEADYGDGSFVRLDEGGFPEIESPETAADDSEEKGSDQG